MQKQITLNLNENTKRLLAQCIKDMNDKVMGLDEDGFDTMQQQFGLDEFELIESLEIFSMEIDFDLRDDIHIDIPQRSNNNE